MITQNNNHEFVVNHITRILHVHGIPPRFTLSDLGSGGKTLKIEGIAIEFHFPDEMCRDTDSIPDALENMINLILDSSEEYTKLKEYRESFKWLVGSK